jgi:hypothetical protein
MTDPILVCPFDEKLLGKLKRWKIVIHTNDLNAIKHVSKEAGKSNDLHVIKIQTEQPLSAIFFKEEWEDLPLAIYSKDFGEYKDLLSQLKRIRNSNVRIFLSSQHDFNYTGLRILSSLNINCGIYFNGGPLNWDLMNDLMHYAIYGRARHATVEPFDWLASHYDPTEYIDYNIVYFNNPTKYLHINEKEQIALTETDLLNGNFIEEGIESLDNIYENSKYVDFINFRYDIMLQMNECAFCPAFRICLAKFQNLKNKKDTCKAFFSDFLDAAGYYFSKKHSKGNYLWQL